MDQSASPRVPFTRANAQKCICNLCPVQIGSHCAKENLKKIGNIGKTELFEPRTVPLLYCASGKAGCDDLETKKSCICGGCEVFSDYSLGSCQPVDHYCALGAVQ